MPIERWFTIVKTQNAPPEDALDNPLFSTQETSIEWEERIVLIHERLSRAVRLFMDGKHPAVWWYEQRTDEKKPRRIDPDQTGSIDVEKLHPCGIPILLTTAFIDILDNLNNRQNMDENLKQYRKLSRQKNQNVNGASFLQQIGRVHYTISGGLYEHGVRGTSKPHKQTECLIEALLALLTIFHDYDINIEELLPIALRIQKK